MSADRLTYLDASALVKLVVIEPETPALVEALRGRRRMTSTALARVEVVRAVRATAPEQIGAARRALAELDLLPLDDRLLAAAADLEDGALRSLDAIHVAAALLMGDALDALVTYDLRMKAAAGRLGVAVVSPV